MDGNTKYKIVERVINSDDQALLTEIYNLLAISDDDFWPDLPSNTQASIERGLRDVHQGNTRPHERVMADIKTRIKE